jgi:flagellar protein FlbD
MVRLTRLNQMPLVVNSDLIEHIEITPDTVITLTTGQKILVRETADQVIERVIEFRRALLKGLTVLEAGGFARITPAGQKDAQRQGHDGY